jgi:cytochrome c556
MKKITTLLALGALVTLFACGGKHHQDHKATAKDSVWKGMDEFHFVMAESFHPFKDSSNLEPAKKLANEMDSVAGVWLAAARPEKVNTDAIKERMEKLKADTKLFAAAVKVEADSTLAKSLDDLHNQFHVLQEAWYSEHAEHEKHD